MQRILRESLTFVKGIIVIRFAVGLLGATKQKEALAEAFERAPSRV
jgi:hypothetical protein